MANSRIKAEVERRLAAKAEKLDLTAERIKANLLQIANGNVGDFVTVGADGHPRVDFSRMTREQAASLASVTVEEFMDGRSDRREVRRIKFTMADRVRANELLGRHFNLFTEKVKHEHEHTIMGTLLDEIDARGRGQVIDHDPDEEMKRAG